MTTVWEAASAAITTLKSLGYTVCFVGGVACSLYGNPRTPHDLDILVLNAYTDQESLKQEVCDRDSSFFLVPSKKIGATYKVLWYRKPHYSYSSYGSYSSGISTRNTLGAIKVDLLLPGVMNIPSFPSNAIVSSNSRRLPAAPLSVVLLLKLQAWSQHRAALEYHYSREQYKDKDDLEVLVPIAAGKDIKPKADLALPNSFITAAQTRVREYLVAYPTSTTRSHWKSMGFEAPRVSTTRTATIPGRSTNSDLDDLTSALSSFSVTPGSGSNTGVRRTRTSYSYGISRY